MVIITGSYLKSLRKKALLSQTELAEKIGISQAHIAKIENGKVNPTLHTVNKILSAITPKETEKCKDLMERNVKFISPNDSVKKTLVIMRRYGISQLPVMKNSMHIGSVSESTLLKNFEHIEGKRVRNIMEKPFPIVDENEDVGILPALLEFHQAVLISSKGKICGIITKLDMLR
ncbi:MAG: CBS domain-containing protein [Candidatus Aenigmarchaeota archaeon]|nr:CBS domain-containing protein [Candidatus Aenigmarchaeota archaeon]